jgi:hypothetical protein
MLFKWRSEMGIPWVTEVSRSASCSLAAAMALHRSRAARVVFHGAPAVAGRIGFVGVGSAAENDGGAATLRGDQFSAALAPADSRDDVAARAGVAKSDTLASISTGACARCMPTGFPVQHERKCCRACHMSMRPIGSSTFAAWIAAANCGHDIAVASEVDV